MSPPNMPVEHVDGYAGSWSSDGAEITFVATADALRSAVFVVARNGINPKQISAWDNQTIRARWSPNGNWIVFERNNAAARAQTLFLVRPDGSETKAISSVGEVLRNSSTWACCTVWSPDGERLLFSNGPAPSKSDLWSVQLDGSHLTRLTHTPAEIWDVDWTAAT